MNDDLLKDTLIPLHQKDVVLLLEAGYLFIEMNKHKEAEEIFVGVSQLVPQSEVPHMAMGHLYFAMGRYSPALKSHQKAISINGRSAAAHAACGEALFFLQRPDEALTCLQTAIELEPEGPAGEFAKALKEAHELGVFSEGDSSPPAAPQE